jgi:hypothetical protein
MFLDSVFLVLVFAPPSALPSHRLDKFWTLEAFRYLSSLVHRTMSYRNSRIYGQGRQGG